MTSYPRTGTADRARITPAEGTRYGCFTFLALGEGYTYRVRCDCGTEVEVNSNSLRRGNTKSCGCLSTGGRGSAQARKKPPSGKDYSNKLYRAWRAIKNRCFNPASEKYPYYSLLPVPMEPDWVGSYETFALEVGYPPSDKHTVDRIHNNLGYVRGNVRWATSKEQAVNRSDNVAITLAGVTKTANQWADELGIKACTIRARYHKGYPAEDILRVGRFSNAGRNKGLRSENETGSSE